MPLNPFLLHCADVSQKFQSVTERKLDGLIFSVDDFCASFRSHEKNAATLSAFDAAAVDAVLNPAALAELGATTIAKYREEFNSIAGAPVNFILPSQLIAVAVATRLMPHDVLLRLGTGQGKSIVLALIAISLLRTSHGVATPHRVIVLTTFDHLAVRDHAFASRIFSREGIRSCAVTSDPVSLNGFAAAQVVYVNAVAIESLVAHLVLKIYGEEALSPSETAFVQTFFGVNTVSTYAVLLDEFDLILDDLRARRPFVFNIPKTMLSEDDVKTYRSVYPPLAEARAQRAGDEQSCVDQDHGGRFSRVSHVMRERGSVVYYLTPAVFRLSQFLEQASRVIGLSGSTNDDDHYVLHGRNGDVPVPYFSMPYSHDPELFDTRILPLEFANDAPIEEGSSASLGEANGIWCRTRAVIGSSVDTTLVVDVHCWSQRIVADIRGVTSQPGPKRPVLIFAPSVDKTFKNGLGVTEPVSRGE